jgi:hypothetical protein
MVNMVEVHDNLNILQIPTMYQVIVQKPYKTQQTPTQKEQEETMEIVVKGSDTFLVTQHKLRVEEETTQNLVGDIDQLEFVMAQIPTKVLYEL